MHTAAMNQTHATRHPATRVVQACMLASLLVTAGVVGAAEDEAAPAASTIEITSSSLPRFDNADGANRTQQRVDMALLSPGRSAFGLTMGVTSLSPPAGGFAGARADNPTGMNLGLQYRYITDSNRRVDITAWRDLGRPNDALSLVQSREAGYGARVEMQLSSSRSAFVADKGFIGVQLDGGARISLKRSAGKPMVYYRNQF